MSRHRKKSYRSAAEFTLGCLVGLAGLTAAVAALPDDDTAPTVVVERCDGLHWAKGETNYDPRKDVNHNGISC